MAAGSLAIPGGVALRRAFLAHPQSAPSRGGASQTLRVLLVLAWL